MDDPPAQGGDVPQRQGLTADDLIFSINRVINPKAPGEAANALSGINAGRDQEGRQPHDHGAVPKPYSTFPESLANNITVYMLPVGFDPKQPDRDRSVQDVPVHPGSAERLRPLSRTTGTRHARTWTDDHDRLLGRDQPGQRAALGPGRRHQRTIPGHHRDGDRIGQKGGHLQRRGLEPVHDAGRPGAVQRCAGQAGVPAVPWTARRCWRPCSAGTARSATTSSGSGPRNMTTAFPSASTTPSKAKSLLKAAGHESLSVNWLPATSRRG